MLFKKCIYIYIILFLSAHFFSVFLLKKHFSIARVEIKGNVKLLKNDIIDKIKNIKGLNIWEVDTEKIKKTLLKDVRIETVKIERQIPDKILIELKEETPYLNVIYKNKMYISNKEGKIYSFINEIKRKDLIIAKINKDKELIQIIEVLKKIKQKDFQTMISEIYIEKNEIFILLKDGVKIITNKNVEKEKYDKVLGLYFYLKNEEKNIEYIDLRFRDYIVK